MAPKRKALSPSPDPLSIPLDPHAARDGVSPHTPSTHLDGPTSAAATPKRPRPVVEIATKRTPTASPAPRHAASPPRAGSSPVVDLAASASRLATVRRSATTGSARGGRGSRGGGGKAAGTSPLTPARRASKATLASSLTKSPLVHTAAAADAPLRSFDDEVFGSPAGAAGDISDAAFRANEALRRQREARNFVFKGDASAPKLTRSGKVIGEADETGAYGTAAAAAVAGDDGDAGAGSLEAGDDDDAGGARRSQRAADVEPVAESAASAPLSAGARAHVLRILSTLTSQPSTAPLLGEDTNEALSNLLTVLKGTVECGEGNSALVTGARGVGKTRVIARALSLLPSTSAHAPIVVRLSGLAQTNDRLAIREMGRQIAEAEGHKPAAEDRDDDEGEEDEEEYAPTTLPSHLLALLTAPSPRAIVIIMEEFDLFTEHAREQLVTRWQLVDVVQSIKPGPVETTGRGVAVIGVTTRVDTLLLLEKRVKSRFSHRVWRVPSPVALGWSDVLKAALIPWDQAAAVADKPLRRWQEDWAFAVDTLLDEDKIRRALDRLAGLTVDVRLLYRPFIAPTLSVLAGEADYISVPAAAASILHQVELAGWGLAHAKLRGLPHPALGVLIIAKHLAYAGREELNLAQVQDEYVRFARTRLVGSGKVRWPAGVLRMAYDHLCAVGLLVGAGRGGRVRSALSPHDVVAYFKGEGGSLLGPELTNWGRTLGGHV